jgi:hypothetical protein
MMIGLISNSSEAPSDFVPVDCISKINSRDCGSIQERRPKESFMDLTLLNRCSSAYSSIISRMEQIMDSSCIF